MARLGRRAGLGMLAVIVAAVIAVALMPVVQPEYAAAASAVSTPSKSVVVKRAATGKLTLKKGSVYHLGAKAQGMKGAKLSFASSKPSVASVVKGRVRALSVGKTTITVIAEKGKAKTRKKVAVTVVAPKNFKKVKAIALSSKTTSLVIGDGARIKATFKPSKASNKNLLFESADPSVASVDAEGRVTAKKAGFVKITATSAENEKVKRALYFTVVRTTPDTIPVLSITAGAERQELLVGESERIDVAVYPANATNQGVTFSSSNEDILTVTDDGIVTARAVGRANIVVRSVENGQVIKTVTFIVSPQPEPETPAPPYDDQEVTEPSAIDSDHDNLIRYSDKTKFVAASNWTLLDDGSVAIRDDSGDEDTAKSGGEKRDAAGRLAAGDVVLFEPTTKHPAGYALKIDEDGVSDGVVSGQRPTLGELFDRVDVETVGGVKISGFVPADGIEIESAETVDLEGPLPRKVREVRPEAMPPEGSDASLGEDGTQAEVDNSALATGAPLRMVGYYPKRDGVSGQSASRFLVALGATGVADEAIDDGADEAGAAEGVTTRFILKADDLAFTIAPSVTTKLDFDESGVHTLYLAVDLGKSSVSGIGVSDLLTARDVEINLGHLEFSTGIPGLSVGADLHAAVSAEGVMSFTITGTSTLGVSYQGDREGTQEGAYKMVVKTQVNDVFIESRENIRTSMQITPELGLWGLPLTSASLSSDFKLESDENARVSARGTICSDYRLSYGAHVDIGQGKNIPDKRVEGESSAVTEGDLFDMQWQKELTRDVVLKKWHMENGRFVNACTTVGGSGSDVAGAAGYDDCSDLMIPNPDTPTVQDTIERDFSLPTSQSVVWIPFTTATENAGVEVSIVDLDDGKFDAKISYGVFTAPDDNAKCVAEKGLSEAATKAFENDDTASFGLEEAQTYYLRLTNASYVNPYYHAVANANKNSLHLELKVMNNDVNESNEDWAHATPLKRGDGTMFRLYGKSDVDVFCFKAPKAGKVKVSIWGESMNFDSKIGYTVFSMNEDGSMNEIGDCGVSDYAAGVFSSARISTFDVPEAGTYYVKVANAYTWNPYFYSSGFDNKTPMYITYDFA